MSAVDDPGVEVEITSGASGPPLVEGRVRSANGLSGQEVVGLTANGVLMALTRVFDIQADTARFSLLIDPEQSYEPPLDAWLLIEGRLAG